MTVEVLLQQLRDSGLDDAGIKALLSEAMASLEGEAEDTPAADEDAERAEAGKLLGVSL